MENSGKEEKTDKEENIDKDGEKHVDLKQNFETKSGYFDLILIVEGQRIPVVKAVLSIASPVFASMLDGEFREKSKSELELPDKKFEDVLLFLSCLYPDKMRPVTTLTMYRLLPYAHEYQVDVLKQRCCKLILETFRKTHINNEEEIYRHAQLAELYNLETLRKKATELASELSVKQMENGSTKYTISDKTKLDIQTMALARHELNTSDDVYVLNSFNITINCKQSANYYTTNYPDTLNFRGLDFLKDRLTGTSTCADILRGLRLSFRFKFDLAYQLSKLCDQTLDDINNFREEIKLLPERLKQSLEEECLRKKCSKFEVLFGC